ncbi:hypothetical protein L195_g051791, partial [Trifolium pratense]
NSAGSMLPIARAHYTLHGALEAAALAHFVLHFVFNDPTTLTEEELYDLRNRWATCFLDLYNPEVDYGDADEKA